LKKHGDFGDWFVPSLNQADSGLSSKIFHAHKGDLPQDLKLVDAYQGLVQRLLWAF